VAVNTAPLTNGLGEPTKNPYSERSVADVLAGRIRLRLAGQDYILPVLTIGQNEDWLATLDASLQPLIEEDLTIEAAVDRLSTFNDKLLDFVYSYDRAHVLPPIKKLRPNVYPHEALIAVMEVRNAANPTLGFALASLMAEARAERAEEAQRIVPDAVERARTSSQPPPTAGPSAKSENLPTNSSSSSTSSQRKRASSMPPGSSSRTPSKQRGSAPSSPRTRGRTTAGATAAGRRSKRAR
jgi:hypothetical protein